MRRHVGDSQGDAEERRQVRGTGKGGVGADCGGTGAGEGGGGVSSQVAPFRVTVGADGGHS